jgi:hypothetical protein
MIFHRRFDHRSPDPCVRSVHSLSSLVGSRQYVFELKKHCCLTQLKVILVTQFFDLYLVGGTAPPPSPPQYSNYECESFPLHSLRY